MTFLDRVKSIRKRWWILGGLLGAPVLVVLLFVFARWIQYRAYQNVELVAILPDDAEAAVRIQNLREAWPKLREAPALQAMAAAREPGRPAGPLTFAEFAAMAGAELPPEATDARILDAAGRDAAVAISWTGGRRDVLVATRIPFSWFLVAPFASWAGPVEKEGTILSAEGMFATFRGDLLIAGTRKEWVEASAARAENGERGRVALELDAAAPEGEPAFWLDVAGARSDPAFGPELRKMFNAVPVREALFMLDLESARAVNGRLVVDGPSARLEGTVTLSSKLGARLEKMYAMPPGEAGLLDMLPATTCYATGARVEALTSWEFLKELTKPSKGPTPKRMPLSEGFGDFVENIYFYLHDGLVSAEEQGVHRILLDAARNDVAIALTTEAEEPFLGVSVLARVAGGEEILKALDEYFDWLWETEEKDRKIFKRERENYHGVDLRVLVGDYDLLGAGVKPAYTIVNDILIVTTSAPTLRAIVDVMQARAKGMTAGPTMAGLRAAAPSDAAAWSYVDVATFRKAFDAMRAVTARTQVARMLESTGPAKIRARVTAEYKEAWKEQHPGEAWVEAEHITDIDRAYGKFVENEEKRVAEELAAFSNRLAPILGLALSVKQGRGDQLDWRAVLTSDRK